MIASAENYFEIQTMLSLIALHACTVNPEIFGVKIFSDTSKYPKIKNTKILCLEIIGVLISDRRSHPKIILLENFLDENFWTRKFSDLRYTCTCTGGLTTILSDNYHSSWNFHVKMFRYLSFGIKLISKQIVIVLGF